MRHAAAYATEAAISEAFGDMDESERMHALQMWRTAGANDIVMQIGVEISDGHTAGMCAKIEGAE